MWYHRIGLSSAIGRLGALGPGEAAQAHGGRFFCEGPTCVGNMHRDRPAHSMNNEFFQSFWALWPGRWICPGCVVRIPAGRPSNTWVERCGVCGDDWMRGSKHERAVKQTPGFHIDSELFAVRRPNLLGAILEYILPGLVHKSCSQNPTLATLTTRNPRHEPVVP